MYLTFDNTDYEERWFKITPAHSGPYRYCSFAIDLFKDLSKGCVNFIETGTGPGGGIFHAFKVGFKKDIVLKSIVLKKTENVLDRTYFL